MEQTHLPGFTSHPTLREMPAAEWPTNRLHHYGGGALSTTELLAVLLGSTDQVTTAAGLLSKYQSLAGLCQASSHELQSYYGIGAATAARIKAALELGRRVMAERTPDVPQIRSPADAANLVMAEMSLLVQEELRVMLLDTKNRVKYVETLYKGSLNTSMVRVGEVFREPVKRTAAAIIIIHNHPTGDPTPSPEDVAVTKQIVETGKLMDIDVLDHLIIGRNRFISLKERGLGF